MDAAQFDDRCRAGLRLAQDLDDLLLGEGLGLHFHHPLVEAILNASLDLIPGSMSVFTDHSLQDAHIFCITDLHRQHTAALRDLTLEYVIAVLRDPHHVHRQTTDRVAAMAIASHRRLSYHPHGAG